MLYLGNWATELDAEGMRDDCDETAETLAYPVGLVLAGRDEAHIQALLTAAWDDCLWIDDEDKKGDPDWVTDGWPEGCDYQKWYSERMGCVVILRVAPMLEPVGGPK